MYFGWTTGERCGRVGRGHRLGNLRAPAGPVGTVARCASCCPDLLEDPECRRAAYAADEPDRPCGSTLGGVEHDLERRRRRRASTGVSGGLGGPGDKAVFSALRGVADVVLVAAGTVRAEHYGPPRTTAGPPGPAAWPGARQPSPASRW